MLRRSAAAALTPPAWRCELRCALLRLRPSASSAPASLCFDFAGGGARSTSSAVPAWRRLRFGAGLRLRLGDAAPCAAPPVLAVTAAGFFAPASASLLASTAPLDCDCELLGVAMPRLASSPLEPPPDCEIDDRDGRHHEHGEGEAERRDQALAPGSARATSRPAARRDRAADVPIAAGEARGGALRRARRRTPAAASGAARAARRTGCRRQIDPSRASLNLVTARCRRVPAFDSLIPRTEAISALSRPAKNLSAISSRSRGAEVGEAGAQGEPPLGAARRPPRPRRRRGRRARRPARPGGRGGAARRAPRCGRCRRARRAARRGSGSKRRRLR